MKYPQFKKGGQLTDLQKELDSLDQQQLILMEEWEELSEQMEG